MPFLPVHAALLYDVDHEADAEAYVVEGCGRKEQGVHLRPSDRKIESQLITERDPTTRDPQALGMKF